MIKIYSGKTKDVYQVDGSTIRLYFKDDATGTNGLFDPGANIVGLKIKDSGHYGLMMSDHLFRLISAEGYYTHYLSSDFANNSMDVSPVTFFGKGVEVICRYVATGSFIKRYGGYISDGTLLDAYVEISLKDDSRGDPFISKELLSLFGIMDYVEYDTIIELTKKISNIIKNELKRKGVELYDLKLEFGKDKAGRIVLIDEISGGNMRCFKEEHKLNPVELAKIVLS